MSKVAIIGNGVMMGDLKGNAIDPEKRKIFEEGIEYGKMQIEKLLQ